MKIAKGKVPYLGNNVQLGISYEQGEKLVLLFTGHRTTTSMIVALCEYNVITEGFLHDCSWVEDSREYSGVSHYDIVEDTQKLTLTLHEGQQCLVEQCTDQTGLIWRFANKKGELNYEELGGWSYGYYYIAEKEVSKAVSKEVYEAWLQSIS